MDDVLLAQKLEGGEELDGEPADELWAEAVVVVADDQLVEVLAQQFEQNADVFPEDDKVLDLDNVRSVVSVLFLHMRQQLDLNKGLLVELGLIPYNLQRQLFLLLMVIHFQHLPITALAHLLQYLVPVRHMIMQLIHILVSTLFKTY